MLRYVVDTVVTASLPSLLLEQQKEQHKMMGKNVVSYVEILIIMCCCL